MSTAIVWFRHDLRLADNPALLAAVHAARHVVPVFIWSPEEEGEWAPGAAARWWLHQSLLQLDGALRQRASRLVLARGPTVASLAEIMRASGATQIYWNCRYEPAARHIEAALRQQLQASGLTGHGFHSSRLVEPGTVQGSNGGPSRVFTPFRRAFLEQARIDAPEGSPARIPAPPRWPASLTLHELALLSPHPWHRKLAEHWQPGEAAARAALGQFLRQRLPDYEDGRDRPDAPSTSRLSPYLRHGELSPRQVWAGVIWQGGSSDSAEQARQGKFCSELIWREFATQQLVLFPTLPDRPRNRLFDAMPWRDAPAEFRAWTRGETGQDLVDAGMRELWQTGWMHNRVRMVTASFLVKNLLLDWRRGQRWFWDTLVDADLASNAYNWQWVAGVGPDAAPWFRIFNPDTQAAKFDPAGTYRHTHLGDHYVPPTPPLVDLKASRLRALAAFSGTLRET